MVPHLESYHLTIFITIIRIFKLFSFRLLRLRKWHQVNFTIFPSSQSMLTCQICKHPLIHETFFYYSWTMLWRIYGSNLQSMKEDFMSFNHLYIYFLILRNFCAHQSQIKIKIINAMILSNCNLFLVSLAIRYYKRCILISLLQYRFGNERQPYSSLYLLRQIKCFLLSKELIE